MIYTKYFKLLTDLDKYDKNAGYIRNEEICKNTDIVLTFWDGKVKVLNI